MHLASFLIPYLVAGVMAMPPLDNESPKSPRILQEENRNARHGLPLYGDVKSRIKNLRTPIHEPQMNSAMGEINLPTIPKQSSKIAMGSAGPHSPTTSGTGDDFPSDEMPNSRLSRRGGGATGPKTGGGGTSGDGGDDDSDDQPNRSSHRHAHSRLVARGGGATSPKTGGGGTSGDGGDDDSDDQPNRSSHRHAHSRLVARGGGATSPKTGGGGTSGDGGDDDSDDQPNHKIRGGSSKRVGNKAKRFVA
ncbi:hypothetical protein PspLS_10329 [Pyricularia sp. CBS 133598]|nr:hypothetical protein PspLS_10329 [Pyricularia sp. CBS 133598]